MKITVSVLVLGVPLLLSGCGTTTTERTASGGAIGAASGAVLGALAGNPALGAAAGAGAGLIGGYLYDQAIKGHID